MAEGLETALDLHKPLAIKIVLGDNDHEKFCGKYWSHKLREELNVS
jgi:hypothetical protein